MNAHALLSSQGWRGHGHSLHKTNDSIGLSKPLLLNRKSNTNGLGAGNAHFNNDQWWLNAFDEQLKGLEMGKKGELKQTVTTGKLNTMKTGALGRYSVYTNFVSGGLLNGTIDLIPKSESTSTSTSEDESDAKKDKSRSKDSKRGKETKEERRAHKEMRRIRKQARAVRRAARQEKREAKAKRKAGKASKSASSSESSDAADEEKRLRRARKEEKRRKRKI